MQRRHLKPAPKRGRYDRSLSRRARQAEQQERLLVWLAEVYRQHGERITVEDVVRAAGVGRNTFYEYFDGLEHALSYATQTFAGQIHERIVRDIAGARTSVAKLRILSRAWLEQTVTAPGPMALLARPGTDPSTSGAVQLFRGLLQHALAPVDSGAAPQTHPHWEACAAFAAEGASGYALRGGAGQAELAEALSVLLTRLFR